MSITSAITWLIRQEVYIVSTETYVVPSIYDNLGETIIAFTVIIDMFGRLYGTIHHLVSLERCSSEYKMPRTSGQRKRVPWDMRLRLGYFETSYLFAKLFLNIFYFIFHSPSGWKLNQFIYFYSKIYLNSSSKYLIILLYFTIFISYYVIINNLKCACNLC